MHTLGYALCVLLDWLFSHRILNSLFSRRKLNWLFSRRILDWLFSRRILDWLFVYLITESGMDKSHCTHWFGFI